MLLERLMNQRRHRHTLTHSQKQTDWMKEREDRKNILWLCLHARKVDVITKSSGLCTQINRNLVRLLDLQILIRLYVRFFGQQCAAVSPKNYSHMPPNGLS